MMIKNNFYNFILCFLLGGAFLFAGNAKKIRQVKANGGILDASLQNRQLVVSTDRGRVEVYRVKNLKKRATIRFKDIVDFYGDPIHPKVFSADILGQKHSRLLAIVECSDGQRRLVQSNLAGKKKTLIDAGKGLQMRKVRFVDKHLALIALMSSEIILFDLDKTVIRYRAQISRSMFSDFKLDEKRKKAAFCSESGEVQIIRVADGVVLRTLKGGNKDNIFKLDYRMGTVLTGGQDRRAVLYNESDGRFRIFNAGFYVYAVAMDKAVKKMAYVANEKSGIDILQIATAKRLSLIPEMDRPVNSLLFKNENRLLICDDGGYIQEWSIK